MTRKRLVALLMACTLCFGVLAGCSSDGVTESNPVQESGATTAKSANSASTVLNIRISGDMPVLDPHMTAGGGADYLIFTQIFNSLVRFENGDQSYVVPCLAEDWDVSDDQMEFTFYLRQDVKFHDGSGFTADDVVFTVERFLTSDYTKSKALMVSHAEKVDDYTVKIHMNYAYPKFILQLASFPWRIVSKQAVETYGDNTMGMMVGTGPYKLTEWNVGQSVTLTANEDCFEGEPYYKTVNFKLITDDQTALTAFENGELDYCDINSGLDAEYIRALDDAKLLEIKRPAAHVVLMNCSGTNEALNNVLVRQAINHAIDKESFVTLAFDDEAYADCYTYLSEGEEGYSEDMVRYEFDLDRANELMAEAGYADGLTFSFTYPTTSVGEAFAAVLKDQLSKIGIELTMVPLEYSAWNTITKTGDFELCYNRWESIPYNAPLVNNLYHISAGSLNFCKVSNERIDELAALGSRELDTEIRKGYFQEIQAIVRGEAYYAPVAYVKANIAVKDEIQGIAFEKNVMIPRIADWYAE